MRTASSQESIASSTPIDSTCPIALWWARMAGFPPWPARKCTSYEENQLRKRKPGPKPHEVAVAFLGIRNERAWVTESNITPFLSTTILDKFDKKKYKNDRDYRAAMNEGVRICVASGDRGFPESILSQVLESLDEFRLELPEFCTNCGGSQHSGDLMQCLYCDAFYVHWHCFRTEDPEAYDKLYICATCCKVSKYSTYWDDPGRVRGLSRLFNLSRSSLSSLKDASPAGHEPLTHSFFLSLLCAFLNRVGRFRSAHSR